MHAPNPSDAPIGVFDSGLGGLSVLLHIRTLLPRENLLYFADSGFAPYGERSETEIIARTLAAASFLIERKAKALVVACNTATAAAIAAVRACHPALPVIGVEPGLKPAAALTRSGIVGVLATERTVASQRFAGLRERLEAAHEVRFLPQACPGLADQVEKGELHTPATARLLRNYVAPLLEQDADTLVLGCTHYPFLRPLIAEICASLRTSPVSIVDTGEAVARQLARVLATNGLLREEGDGSLCAYTTGAPATLSAAIARLLGLRVKAFAVVP